MVNGEHDSILSMNSSNNYGLWYLQLLQALEDHKAFLVTGIITWICCYLLSDTVYNKTPGYMLILMPGLVISYLLISTSINIYPQGINWVDVRLKESNSPWKSVVLPSR